jgi:hypothetical protein
MLVKHYFVQKVSFRRGSAKDLRVLRLPGIAFGKPLSAQNIARHWLGE